MMALALGLKNSGKPFIWCIRPLIGLDSKGENFKDEWLPKGFTEVIVKDNQVLIVYGWTPQLEILYPKSTYAFLSHCGWNSAMENLSQDVPIIGYPLAGEQSYNSKILMEEMGVSVELTRGTQSFLDKEDVKKDLDQTIQDKKGLRNHLKLTRMVDENVIKKLSSLAKKPQNNKTNSDVKLKINQAYSSYPSLD